MNLSPTSLSKGGKSMHPKHKSLMFGLCLTSLATFTSACATDECNIGKNTAAGNPACAEGETCEIRDTDGLDLDGEESRCVVDA